MRKTADARRPLPTAFEDLVRLFPPRAIQDRHDYDNTVEIMDRLAVLDRRAPGQERYLDTLTILVERYDQERHAIDTSRLTPHETLRYLVQQSGMSASELGRLVGDRSLGSKLLHGQRRLEKYARTLADYFKVSADLFV